MNLGLTGRIYIVGGGSRGLGRAVAVELHAEGASVVLVARDGGSLDAVAADLGDGRAFAVRADMGDLSAAARLVDVAFAETGRLDGALLNVGGPAGGGALDVDDDTWRGAFETAFLAPLRLARTAARRLERDGSLLFVLSSSARSPIAGLATSNGLRVLGWRCLPRTCCHPQRRRHGCCASRRRRHAASGVTGVREDAMSENPAIHRLASGDVDIALPAPERRAVTEDNQETPAPPAPDRGNMIESE